MIQAKDLRLNNYINHKDLGIVKVISISSKIGDHESVFVESLKDRFDYNFDLDEDLKPIPLTEEILLKAGGQKKEYITLGLTKGRDLLFTTRHTEYYQVFLLHNDDMIALSMDEIYLHQFQNLYFALTGKELEVKL